MYNTRPFAVALTTGIVDQLSIEYLLALLSCIVTSKQTHISSVSISQL